MKGSTGFMGSLRSRRAVAAVMASSALLLSGCDFQIYDLPLPGGADVGDGAYKVKVEFRDVLDLVPQSAVRVDDIAVGRVEDVQLKGYTAEVTLLVRKDTKLPDNAEAEIRQTSLLGEKFVSLKAPEDPSSEPLGNGDVIGLDRSGRNTEVEEVLGALSLLLNGGGVGQLKIINEELNKALDGRTGTVKSLLRQLRTFMTQLDGSRNEILTALEQVNNLSKSVNANTDTLDLALDELPGAIRTVEGQRKDLVKMLKALANLSGTATRVILASKAGTIDSLNALLPTLRGFADAGDAFPKALQVFLTYPFIDAVVGKTAAQARDLHMGDYTNLNAALTIDVADLLGAGGTGGGGPCVPDTPLCLPGLGGNGPKLPDVPLGSALPSVKLPGSGTKSGSGSGSGGGLLGGLGLGRAAVGPQAGPAASSISHEAQDRLELTALLGWGVLSR
jgi:phospholipid/cholesterol/gamma-HCH transport system substrate-binding protein